MRVAPFFISFVLCLFVQFPVEGWAEFKVIDIALAQTVKNREPVGLFSPAAYCEKDKNNRPDIPVIDSLSFNQVYQVYLWSRIAASTEGKIRFTWRYQEEEDWKIMAKIDLAIRPSSGYRLWSSKSLYPGTFIGHWMVVIAPSDTPNEILCIARFTVQ